MMNNMMNKKGFTMIEILGILVIIGLIAIISIPTIGRITTNSNEELYKIQLENIERGARNWATKNASLLPENEGEVVTIYLEQLKTSDDIVVDIRNPITKELFPNDMIIEIKRHANNYIYLIDEASGTDNGYFDPENLIPTLILNGQPSEYVEINADYEDPGVIARKIDGSALTNIIREVRSNNALVSDVDTSRLGQYLITYTAKENDVEVSAKRTVVVRDTIPPVITHSGDVEVNQSGVNSFDFYEGVEVTDNSKQAVNLTVNTSLSNIPGNYTVTYTATDNSNNESTATRIVTVIDDLGPVITFNPAGNDNWSQNHSLTINLVDPSGIYLGSPKYLITTSASGITENQITNNFSSGDTINLSGLTGDYYVWVTATDNLGNKTISRSEIFKLDNTKPTIAHPGNVTINVQQVANFNLMNGVTATDNESGISGNISVSGSLSILPGNYPITYSVVDGAGNNISVSRIITVIDVEAPVITLNGPNPMTLDTFQAYVEPGATALDDVDGHISNSGITKTGSVNVNVPGTYTVTYSVTDSSGNAGTAVRTVNVVDTVNPTVSFSMNGNNNWAQSRSTNVTVSDNVAVNNSSLRYLWSTSTSTPAVGSFTSSFSNGGSISTPSGVTGNYYLWILASDTSGNTVRIRSNAFRLDNVLPIVTFGTNGNNNWDKSHSTTVTVSDNTAVNNNSLRYLWSTSTSTPAVGSFTNSFSNGGSISTPSGVTGNYYLWILASDTSGNTARIRSNVFRIDNTPPVISGITINRSTPRSSEFTITRSGNASDSQSNLSTNPYIYQLSQDRINWTNHCEGTETSCAVPISRNTQYYYRVCVYDKVGNEACTESKSASVRYYSSCSTCTRTETKPANTTIERTGILCPSGYVWNVYRQLCADTPEDKSGPDINFIHWICPEGYTRGNRLFCERTVYSCSAGFTLSGTTCSREYEEDCNCSSGYQFYN